MDGWIKWLGELVWRLSKLPEKVRGDEREENFFYRLYGVLALFGSISLLAYGVYLSATPLSELVATLAKYTGPDKFLAQGYALALAIIVVIPIIFFAALALAMIMTIPTGLSLLVVRLVGWLSYRWASRFKAKHPPKEMTTEERQAFTILLLGVLATIILWIAVTSGVKPFAGPSPDSPEPPDDQNKDTQPAA